MSDAAAELQYPETFELFDRHPELTDIGNAERFATVNGKDFRWCPAWGKWLHWDGARWCPDEREITLDTAMKFIRYCRAMAEQIDDRGRRDDVLESLAKCESRSKLTSMIELVKAKLPIVPDELDEDKMVFNCANGTLDLRSGEIRQHDRADGITKVSPVSYSPLAECPKWLTFLDEISLGRKEIVDFLQAFVGYCMTGETREQVFLVCHGLGQNGKTVFVNTVLNLLGDYGREMPADLLLIRKNEGIPNDLATLRGHRFITCAESESGARLAESRVKAMSGQDAITARFLFGEYFSFTPQFKLLLRTNHRPRIRGSDHAIWRRIALVPFEYQVPPEKQNPRLEEELREEASGILRWAVEGCLRWQREGLVRPEVIKAATESYREAEDILGDFLRERTTADKGGKVQSSVLYRSYVSWTQSNGGRQISQKAFSEALEERGMEKMTTRNGVYWFGLLEV